MGLKVLHVIPAVAPRYGGPSVAVTRMCRALADTGTEALIATTDADGSGRLTVALGRETTYEGARTVFFRRRLGEAFKWSGALARWLRHEVSRFDAVHVHAVFSHASLAAGAACRRAGVPYVVRPLGSLDPWSLDRRAARKRLLMGAGAGRLLRQSAAIHYTSAEERRRAEERLPWLARGVVVPLGVDEEFFADGGPAPAGDRVVLSLGRLHEKKGLEPLIDAWHELTRAGSIGGWRLVLAGNGERGYVERLHQRSATGPAAGRIEFPGWIEGAARPRVMRSARLFVLPSHQENFGVALVEALASGVPAVVTPGVNLAGDIVTAGAGWLSGPETDALAATLGAAMSSRDELDRRGRLARGFAGRFRWPLVADALNAMYREVTRVPAAALEPSTRLAGGR